MSLLFAERSGGGETVSTPAKWLGLGLAWLFITLLFWFCFASLRYNWNWPGLWKYRQRFMAGWCMTVVISAASLALSSLIGLVTALARRARFLPLRFLALTYVELTRGTPLLVQILIFFYVVADAFHVQNRYLAGTLILSFFGGAYLSEIIRAGIEGVGRSQLESAAAIGLTTVQTYRYVVFPQALRRILPPLAGQFVSLVKDSSLLSVISIGEFTKNAQEVNSFTYSTLESYLPLAFGYLIITLPISFWTRRLESRCHFET
jgi:polar amino acid transport system permease protein